MAFIKLLTTLTSIGLLLIFTMPATTSTMETKDLEAFTNATNNFAITLYQALKKEGENTIVSPISVQIVLALAYTGAKGNSAAEIAKVLNLPDKLEDVYKGYKMLTEQLQHPVLKLATKIFVEETLNVNPEFQQGAAKYFQSDAGLVSFIKDPEGSRMQVNKWVEEKTNQKIKDLLAPGVIDSLTRMILTNAIHFKANWASKFDPDMTVDGDFHITPTNKIKVKMMSKKKKFPFRHHSELDAKILELPYDGNEFKMVIILPNKLDGLSEVENKLSTMNFEEVFSSLHEIEVNVKIPKFKIESTIEMKDYLIQLGIKDIFDVGKANFSGITTDERLYASKVIQKAFIEVNEEGTEAAAATAIKVESRSLLIFDEEYFDANHPFIYVLFNHKIPLFIGSIHRL